MFETQEEREAERNSLIEIIKMKFGSIRRFCDVTESLKYHNFRNMLLRSPISDWQLERIRWVKKLAMDTSNKKLNDEIKISEINRINRTLRERGLSQNWLSKELGVPRTTLRDLLDFQVKKKNGLYFQIIEFLEIEP